MVLLLHVGLLYIQLRTVRAGLSQRHPRPVPGNVASV